MGGAVSSNPASVLAWPDGGTGGRLTPPPQAPAVRQREPEECPAPCAPWQPVLWVGGALGGTSGALLHGTYSQAITSNSPAFTASVSVVHWSAVMVTMVSGRSLSRNATMPGTFTATCGQLSTRASRQAAAAANSNSGTELMVPIPSLYVWGIGPRRIATRPGHSTCPGFPKPGRGSNRRGSPSRDR